AVPLRARLGEAQAQAAAFDAARFGRLYAVELLADVRQVVRRNADSLVLHAHRGHPLALAARDAHLTALRRILDRVADQVADGFLKLLRIPIDDARPVRHQAQAHVLRAGARFEVTHLLVDERRQIGR